MKGWKKWLLILEAAFWSALPDILAVAGAACVTRGAALIYPPAGWLAGGTLCIAAAVLVSKGSGDG